MGARPQDYAVSAPYKSYIHVDDFDGPKELAEYLHKLDQDDQLYNEYFKWKVCIFPRLFSFEFRFDAYSDSIPFSNFQLRTF